MTPAAQANGLPTATQLLGPQAAKLRCPGCAGDVELTFLSETAGYPDLGADGTLTCAGCGTDYPIIAGTPRMLTAEHRRALPDRYPLARVPSAADDQPDRRGDADIAVKQLTAASFAYEWQHFGGLREQWQKNFADYMRPHAPASLAGREILDVGAGSGRHSVHAARAGAHVVAVDLGASIDVARRNLPASVLTVQADAEALPFAPESFDLVMAIGVLHHLPDPDRALRSMVRYARTAGHVHVYVYWLPERRWQRRVLGLVTAVRRATVRMDHRVLHALCYPLAAALLIAIVAPQRALRAPAPWPRPRRRPSIEDLRRLSVRRPGQRSVRPLLGAARAPLHGRRSERLAGRCRTRGRRGVGEPRLAGRRTPSAGNPDGLGARGMNPVEAAAPGASLRVAAESAYPTLTPGPRVRVFAYIPFLAALGIDLSFRSHISDDEYRVLSGAAPRSAKAAVVARCAARVARRARPPGALVMVHRLLSLVPVPTRDPPSRLDVYDFDDALFHGSISTRHRAFRALKREAERCDAHLRKAALVVAGNDYLGSHAMSRARRVEVVPSCVDPSLQPLRDHTDVEILTVGWVGSHSTAVCLQTVLPVFRAINRGRTRMKLLTMGAGALPEEPWLEQHPWSLQAERTMLASIDVGIMPLPDDPWSRGKCGYKLVQYYAAGVPAIASPVGVNRTLLRRGGGIAATSAREWRSALETFDADALERRQAGLTGRKLVEADYSYQRWAPELAAMLRSI